MTGASASGRTLARIAHSVSGVLLLISALSYLAWLPSAPIGAPLTDFSAYYAAGQYWSHGGDPYGAGIWNTERTIPGFHPAEVDLLPFVGPPLSLPLWAALSALPYPGAATVWCGVVTIW